MVCEAPPEVSFGFLWMIAYDHGLSGQRTLLLERAVEAMISIPCLLKCCSSSFLRNFSSLPHRALSVHDSLGPGQSCGRPGPSPYNQSNPEHNDWSANGT